MEDDFSDAQNNFCMKHCHKFDDNDENKFVLVFNYTHLLENMLDTKLRAKIHVRSTV